jgi:hypothetical protein
MQKKLVARPLCCYSALAMNVKLEVMMEVEKFDSEGNTIGVFDVKVKGIYSEDAGDHYNPPHESMEIDSVLLGDGDDYELSSDEEERAMEMLYEALADLAD